ncbi:MAG: glycosyltransferase [Patescibacteria group bacterium]
MKISIVMPVYNREDFLPEVLQSYFNQTDKDWELIIVDDCSIDSSFTICQDLAKKDDRIKCFRLKKNSGVAIARDYGNKKANGDIIVVADSDDFAYPDRIKIIREYFEKNPDADIFYTNMDLNYIDDGIVKPRFFQPYVKDLLYNINFVPNASSSYKKSAYVKVEGYDSEQKIGEDYDLWLQFSDKNMKFGYDPRPTVKVTMHKKSIRSEEQDKHRSYIERVWKKHKSAGADLTQVKQLANKETYDFFSQPNKLELWFNIKN